MLAVLMSVAESRALIVVSGGPGPPAESDIRLKRDITQVGELDSSVGLYRYRYHWSDTTYVGVMAQEVARSCPKLFNAGRTDICASIMGVSVCGCRPGTSGLQRIDGSALQSPPHRRHWKESPLV